MSKLSKWIDKKITHKSAYKEEVGALNEQIATYQQQKDMMHSENEKLAKEKGAEMMRIHEKQIRALRRQFRSPGFLEQPSMGDTSTTLG
jgi:chromosome segregation ATPase